MSAHRLLASLVTVINTGACDQWGGPRRRLTSGGAVLWRARFGLGLEACSIAGALELAVVFSGAEGAQIRTESAPVARRVARAVPNDNRVAAGRLTGRALVLRLEARDVSWYPEGASGAAVPAFAFAEDGRPPSVPGPMIRVAAGTEIRVTVRNALAKPLRLRGLQERAGAALDSVVIAPDATHDFRFRADVPGTYYYWGRTEPIPANALPGRGRDGPLVGALIVDPAGTSPPKDERVLVMTGWADSVSALGVKSNAADRVMRREVVPRDDWFVVAVNGGSWPHTERLSYAVGDTVRWRVINAMWFPHPMHLHGFYFDVDARGDAQRDTAYRAEQRRTAVTEWMVGGATMRMTWAPVRAGNWLFHCHLVTHVSDALRLPSRAKGGRRPNETRHADHAERGMAGLVMGIRVSAARGAAPARDARPRRTLRLFVTERANVYGDQPGYSYVLQEGPTPPAPDSVRGAGSTLVLRRNEPTEITVVNVAKHTTAIHWHGIELESFYDGVGGWSGWGTRVAPPIAPGDSFVVRLTPPRAGTFIYHTHVEEGTQLASGLNGALLVLPEDAGSDSTDRVLLVSIGGPHDDARPFVNGSAAPPLIELRAGVAHRFRLINISPLETHIVQLASGGAVQQWRALAKDGADLPAHQAVTQRARLLLHPGETYDFEVLLPRRDSLSLTIDSPGTVASRLATRMRSLSAPLPRIVTEIPVIVR